MVSIIFLLLIQTMTIEQQGILLRDLHQSMAVLSQGAERSSFVYGPLARDIFDCIEKAKDINSNVPEISNYGINYYYYGNIIEYKFYSLYDVEGLLFEYQDARDFSCIRYVNNNELIVYLSD